MTGKEAPAAAVVRTATALASLLRQADNKAVYSRPDVVSSYSDYNDLQPPERAILGRLETWLTGRSMLDVGVGAGRTTGYFAPLAASYVGVDYSPPMIAACKARFADETGNITFAVEDVRDLGRFGTGSFDFVLFSHNGLDCIDHDGRLTALAEIHRVCAPSGFFCFSSHNLGAVSELFRLRPYQRAKARLRVQGSVEQLIFRMLNGPESKLARRGHALVRESYLQFRSSVYYIHPGEQLAQLHDAGFSRVESYGRDGRRIEPSEAAGTGGLWLYYLAARSARSPRLP